MRKIVLLVIMVITLIISVTSNIEAKLSIEEVVSSNDSENIIVYFPRLPDIKLISEEIEVDNNMGNEEKIELIIDRLSKGSEKANIIDVIPNGSKLNSVYVENNIAFVDFSQEFVDNHPGGSIGEYNTIYSIVNSITEIDGINGVSFLINGQKQETYKGHTQFDIPIVRDESMIVTE